MALGACEVHQPAFAEKIDDAAIGKMVSVDVARHVAIDFFCGVAPVPRLSAEEPQRWVSRSPADTFPYNP
jgi:hypothetical protein